MSSTRTALQDRPVDQVELVRLVSRYINRRRHRCGDPAILARAANAIVGEFGVDQSGTGLAAWFADNPVGYSARAMAAHLGPLAGQEWARQAIEDDDRCDSPLSAGDFGRCVRLLDAVPSLRPHLPRLAELSATWAGYAARWDELERLYRRAVPGSWPSDCDRLLETIRDEVWREQQAQVAPR